MHADISEDILKALVSLLHPQREIELGKMFTETPKESTESSESSQDEEFGESAMSLNVFIVLLSLID